MLGQPTWAHYAMELKMAGDPERVRTFYEELLPSLGETVQGELDRLEGLLTADGHDGPIMAWDWRYYDDALRRTEYGVDQDRISEYLPLDPTMEGMFAITGEVLRPRVPRPPRDARLARVCPALRDPRQGHRQVSRPLLRRPLPARGQVRARGRLPARRRPSRGRWRVRRAGERDRRELHAAVRRPARRCCATPRSRRSSTSSATSCT